jgi:hypothetical protein
MYKIYLWGLLAKALFPGREFMKPVKLLLHPDINKITSTLCTNTNCLFCVPIT